MAIWPDMYNAASVRAVLEATGNGTVKLVLSGHNHWNKSYTVNGIEYRTLCSTGDSAAAGALLYLYDDGTWKMAASRGQVPYNWPNHYVSASTGNDSYGGHLVNDAKKTLTAIEISSGVDTPIINVATGTYNETLTISQTGATWNFADGAIISGLSDVSGVGDAWSEGEDENGWYTKTSVTTEPKILLRDDTLAYEWTYSDNVSASSSTLFDWNSDTLYYHDGDGDAPGSHTITISQLESGIACSNACASNTVNGAEIVGFNSGVYLYGAPANNEFNDLVAHDNYTGVNLNAVVTTDATTFNRPYLHDNLFAGIYSSSINYPAPIFNYVLATVNGLKCLSASDGGAIKIDNGNYEPIINNAVLMGNYNGLRATMNTGSTHGPVLQNVITYGNTNKGIFVDGTLNPAGSISYSIVNDSTTWGNLTHSTGISTANPKFRTATDFHLTAGSPAINGGTNVGLTTDYEGAAVPYSSTPDCGIYEYKPASVHR
jgi:hypothetical protein